ncbi:MAG TPA: glycosyltransferase family 4 protein [Pyrinomonadaceae bacterium]
MSIALLLDSAPRTWTSQEDIHLRLCERLRETGSRIVLVFAAEIKKELADRFREGGAEIEIANYGDGRWQYLRRLHHVIRRYDVSLVHICFFDYFSAVPWLAQMGGAQHIIFEQLNGGELTATSWKKQLIRARGATATEPATKVIAISEFVREQLIKCGVAPEKIIVRHLGVDTKRFHPDPAARQRLRTELGIQPDEIILSTVSVLRPIKNPDIILQACALLASRAVPFKLLVAGDGVMLDELRNLAVELGIADRTHWLGYCDDPAPLLQGSDIFVLATKCEAFGLVTAEAMACGVPVVGSRSGGTQEIVEDGVSGLLATPLEPVSFADAIEKMARDYTLRRAMSLRGLARVREKFNVERDAEDTLKIYQEVVSE